MTKKLPFRVAAFMFACLCIRPAIAQTPNTLTGTVVDAATDKGVGYATVALLRDSTVVNAAAAGLDGGFALKAPEAGRYDLSVTMVGYAPFGQSVEIPAEGKALGKILLTQGVDVGDVVVEVQKPLVMSDAEKTTYSVEDDPQASTSTLEEIIRKVPQLSLDGDGNVLLNGQSNYKILVNGHSSATMSNNFKEVIQSMPASQISRIEVITNPSTRYDAEGVGGIINLITQKKKQFYGYNGNVGAGVGVVNNPNYNANVNLQMQAGKFAAGVMGYFGYYDGGRTPSTGESWTEHFDSENRYNHSTSEHRWNSRFGNVGLEMSYQPDTLNLLTFNGWLWTGDNRNKSTSQTTILDPDMNPLQQYGSRNIQPWKFLGVSLSLNYEHTFGKQGHTLTLSDEVETSPGDGGIGDNLYYGDYSYRALRDESTRSTGNTVQIDYVNPLAEHHQIEAGLKHIYRNNDSDTRIDKSDAEGAFPDENRKTTDMEYRQHILALYAGYGITYAKWSGRAGARMERTWNDADVDDTDQGVYSFANRQFNVVPYLSLTYIPQVSHNLSLSYTQRLQRPGIYMLSPAVNDTDPMNRSYGNPGLEATVYHSVNLQYSHYTAKWSMTFALNTILSNNNMSSYTTSDQEGVTTTTYSNDVRSRSYSFNGSFSVRPSDKFNLSLSYYGGYSQNDYDAMEIHTDQFTFDQNLNLDFALWKEARFMAGESYSTGSAWLGNKSESFYYYYFGIKQQFFKKRLDLNITVSNPFENYRSQKNIVDTPTHGGWSRFRHPCRSLNFRISYRFGKQNIGVKRTARSISNDDIAGGSQGGGTPGGGAAGGR